MPTRKAEARWSGKLKDGKGTMKLGSGHFEGQYSFPSRFENGQGTNPEELIGAAEAGCYSMAFSLMLENAGFPPEEIHTEAEVTLDKAGEGFAITQIALKTRGRVPNIDEAKFIDIAEQAKTGCPVSKALTGTTITLDAKLA